jgi:hypothetical protein
MMNGFRVIGVAGAALLTGGLMAGTASAAPHAVAAPTASTASSAVAEACQVNLGTVTAAGDHRAQVFSATVPPTRTIDKIVGRGVYPAGLAWRSGPMLADPNAGGPDVSGYLILGNGMYRSRYAASFDDGEIFSSSLERIGGGWGIYTVFDESAYEDGSFSRTNEYGMRSDGLLYRWTLDSKGVWRNVTTYPGFAAVKTMALISKTRTYDTFLANTRGGALYTIHIPTTSPMKPVVKVVRSSTWQGFDSLVAAGCGQYGVLLLGIDKDTGSGHMYAVGHANGTATVIQSRGSLPATFVDPVYFRWTAPIAPLNGE